MSWLSYYSLADVGVLRVSFYHDNVCSRQEFVDAYVDYVFNKSVASLFEGFYSGFHKVCGGRVLDLFQPSELQAMIIGNTNYDWTELEKVTFHNLLLFFVKVSIPFHILSHCKIQSFIYGDFFMMD